MQRKVVIGNPQGLHMRPSAAFVECARRFQSDVRVTNPSGVVANGKSILDLFTLVAECGTELTIEAEGPDAAGALDALAEVLARVPVET